MNTLFTMITRWVISLRRQRGLILFRVDEFLSIWMDILFYLSETLFHLSKATTHFSMRSRLPHEFILDLVFQGFIFKADYEKVAYAH
jgi:hypothetical protein